MAKPITIKITGDDKKFKAATQRTNANISSIGTKAVAMGNLFAGVIRNMSSQLTDFGTSIVSLASEQEETLGKLRAVAGDGWADQVIVDAEAAAKALGVSTNEYAAIVATQLDLRKQLGESEEQAYLNSTRWTQTLVDAASFHNASVEDMSDAWNSAARGEMEAIQRYLPQITGTFIEEYGIRNELIEKNTAAMTVAERLRVLDAIAADEQINSSIGDFARTSSGYANSVKIMGAQWENFKVGIGNAVLPALTQLVQKLSSDVLPRVQELWQTFKNDVVPVIKEDVLPVLQDIGGAVLDVLVDAFEDLSSKVATFVEFLGEVHEWLIEKGIYDALVEVGEVVGGALADGFEWLVEALEDAVGWFKNLDGVVETLLAVAGVALVTWLGFVTVGFLTSAAAAAAAAAAWVIALGPVVLIIAGITTVAAVFYLLYRNVGFVRDAVDWTWQKMQEFADWVVDDLVPVLVSIWEKALKPTFDVVFRHIKMWADMFMSVASWVRDELLPVLLSIRTVFVDVVKQVIRKLDEIVRFFVRLRGRIWPYVQKVLTFLKDGITGVNDWFATKINAIVGLFSGLPRRISNAVGGMFNGLKSAFKSAMNWIIDKWNGLEMRADMPWPAPDVVLRTPNIPRFAFGGQAGRAGNYMVGERGPELVTLPQGARVEPNHGAGMGGAGVTINVATNANAADIGREIAWLLQTGGI